MANIDFNGYDLKSVIDDQTNMGNGAGINTAAGTVINDFFQGADPGITYYPSNYTIEENNSQFSYTIQGTDVAEFSSPGYMSTGVSTGPTIPSWANYATIICIGGGGGGGAGFDGKGNGPNGGSGGGGASGYCNIFRYLEINPVNGTLQLQVGQGGTGGQNNLGDITNALTYNLGKDGQYSRVLYQGNTVVQAPGGLGGRPGTQTVGGVGGSAGTTVGYTVITSNGPGAGGSRYPTQSNHNSSGQPNTRTIYSSGGTAGDNSNKTGGQGASVDFHQGQGITRISTITSGYGGNGGDGGGFQGSLSSQGQNGQAGNNGYIRVYWHPNMV